MIPQSRKPWAKSAGSKPRFWFGPGLLLAITAGILIRQFMPRHSVKPIVEHTPQPAQAASGLSAPDPKWLAARYGTLELSDSQLSKLRAMETRCERGTLALRTELDNASANFSPGTSGTNPRGASIEAIQQQSAPISDLTRQLLDARRAWWAEAASLLTPAQRRQAEQAWADRFNDGRRGHGK